MVRLSISVIGVLIALNAAHSQLAAGAERTPLRSAVQELFPNVWDDQHFEAVGPPYPGIFQQISGFNPLYSRSDAFALRDIKLGFYRYGTSEDGTKRGLMPFDLTIPAGTRLTRQGSGVGSSMNPRSRFFSMTLKLDPCPEGFPRSSGMLAQKPADPYSALMFQITGHDMQNCLLSVLFYRPRITDEESKGFVRALGLVPHRADLPRPSGSTLNPQVSEDRMESGKEGPGRTGDSTPRGVPVSGSGSSTGGQ